MSDFGARTIAAAIRFLGLCIFVAVIGPKARNFQDATDRVISDY